MPTVDEIARRMAEMNDAINHSTGCSWHIGFTPYVSGYTDTDYACCCCTGDPQPSNVIEGTCKDVTEEEK